MIFKLLYEKQLGEAGSQASRWHLFLETHDCLSHSSEGLFKGHQKQGLML